MKIFFSHASEDKALVEQVFLTVGQHFPDIKGWLDKFEILGGHDLIDKLHEGISTSDKFLIFLSSNSIDKPWVKAGRDQKALKINPQSSWRLPFPARF